jgi:hypothetical protein
MSEETMEHGSQDVEATTPAEPIEGTDVSQEDMGTGEHGEDLHEEVTPSAEEDSDISDTGQEGETQEGEDHSGQLRHEDYTRKTQALAEERKALEAEREAFKQQQLELQRQNLEAIEAIKEQSRLQAMTPEEREQYEAQNHINKMIDQRVKPIEEKIKSEYEQKFKQVEEKAFDQKLFREEQMLKDRYGLNQEQVLEVEQFALDNGLNSIEHAYKVMSFDSKLVTARKQGAKAAAKQIKRRQPTPAVQPEEDPVSESYDLNEITETVKSKY